MTNYIYWGNRNEQSEGTAAIRVTAGWVHVGDSIDFTVAEYSALNPRFDLRAGTGVAQRTGFQYPRLAR